MLEQLVYFIQQLTLLFKIDFYSVSSNRFNSTNPRSNCALRDDFKMPNFRGILNVSSPTQFDGLPKLNGSYRISIFFAKKCHGSLFNSFVKRSITFLLQLNLFLNSSIHKLFYSSEFFSTNFCKM